MVVLGFFGCEGRVPARCPADAGRSAACANAFSQDVGMSDVPDVPLGDVGVQDMGITSVLDVPDGGIRVVSLAAGHAHVCALMNDRTVRCWGSNGCGQLGDGTQSGSATARPVSVGDGGVLQGVTSVAAGFRHTCAVAMGRVYCWGGGEALAIPSTATGGAGGLPTPIVIDAGVLDTVAVGWRHACVIGVGVGQVTCWGWNENGMAGQSPSRTEVPPSLVSGIVGASQVAAGERHTCALIDGGVSCWGGDMEGQLGDGEASSAARSTPELVQWARDAGMPPPRVLQLASGAHHTCAVVDGGAWCWGAGSNGRITPGSTADRFAPVPIAGLGASPSISAGAFHTCALVDGGVSCWGSNYHGQLGSGAREGR